MNIFGIHWCMDETMALLAVLPFIGVYFGRLKAWWHARCACPSHDEPGHDHDHNDEGHA